MDVKAEFPWLSSFDDLASHYRAQSGLDLHKRSIQCINMMWSMVLSHSGWHQIWGHYYITCSSSDPRFLAQLILRDGQMNAHFSQLHSYFTSGARHVYSNIKDREMAEGLTRNPSRFILPTNGSSPWFNGENCWSFTQIHHSHKPARFTLIISLVCLEKRGEDATNQVQTPHGDSRCVSFMFMPSMSWRVAKKWAGTNVRRLIKWTSTRLAQTRTLRLLVLLCLPASLSTWAMKGVNMRYLKTSRIPSPLLLEGEIAYYRIYYINLALHRKRIDYRDRRDRTELTTKHWQAQLDILVRAYLNFRMRQGADGLLANPVVDDSAPLIEIETIDLFCMFLITSGMNWWSKFTNSS